MELFFLAVLFLTMAFALGSGYPVAFSLPGAAIISIVAAAAFGYLFEGSSDAYFHSGGPYEWLSAGVTNLRFVYWDVERDTLIAIPLFIFMGIMLQKSKIAEDLLVTMANLFGPVPVGRNFCSFCWSPSCSYYGHSRCNGSGYGIDIFTGYAKK